MDQEQIIRKWNEFLEKENNSLIGSHFLKNHLCGNCRHWVLLSENDLSTFESSSEYKNIVQGFNGQIIKPFKENGEVIDSYSVYLFHGWCKRFPPMQDNEFPLVSHEDTCGEWGKRND